MTRRKHTPIHDFWRRRVEGQIRDAINSHPEWFNFTSESQKLTMVNSLAKRIVGEIAAAYSVAAKPAGVALDCSSPEGSEGGRILPSDGGGVAANCAPSECPQSGESVYDAEVAPLLQRAGEICERHGLPFVAQVEYQPDDFGRTAYLGANPSIAMRLLYWASVACGNLDRLVFTAARHGKEHGHNSIVLTTLERRS